MPKATRERCPEGSARRLRIVATVPATGRPRPWRMSLKAPHGMTAVDRLGFHVRLKTPDRVRGARIAFLREVRNPEETRKVLVEMVKQARGS
jgi:uncharacterized protein DUF2470